MTRQELDAILEVRGVKLKAKDIVPGLYSIPCVFPGVGHLLNPISIGRWAEDGVRLVWMLDSHNFQFTNPDTEFVVVKEHSEYLTNARILEYRNQHAEVMATPPKKRGKRKR